MPDHLVHACDCPPCARQHRAVFEHARAIATFNAAEAALHKTRRLTLPYITLFLSLTRPLHP